MLCIWKSQVLVGVGRRVELTAALHAKLAAVCVGAEDVEHQVSALHRDRRNSFTASVSGDAIGDHCCLFGPDAGLWGRPARQTLDADFISSSLEVESSCRDVQVRVLKNSRALSIFKVLMLIRGITGLIIELQYSR